VRYAVVIQPPAAEEIDAAFLYIAEHSSPDTAVNWFNNLETRLETLATMPRRCSFAPEDEYFAEEIRNLLVEPYRVLFTIRKGTVHILHVRHMARRTLEQSDS